MNLILKIGWYAAVALLPVIVLNGEEKKQAANSPVVEVLEDSGLRVIAKKPLAMGGYFRGSRFDRSSMIISAQFGKHHYFTTWESTINPENNCGSGPTEEFDMSEAGTNGPPGYREAKAGDLFLKISVGWLRKEANEEYNSFKNYSVIEPGAWTVKRTKNSVLFAHEPGGRLGYNYRYEKEIAINGSEGKLTVNHYLKNTGTKTIQTVHYCHNFILIDNEYVGPDYQFEINREPVAGSSLPAWLQKNNSTWKIAQDIDGAIWTQFEAQGKDQEPLKVLITNTATGGKLRFSTKSPLKAFTLFAEKKTICPEPFVSIKLLPGQEYRWSWEYEFLGD